MEHTRADEATVSGVQTQLDSLGFGGYQYLLLLGIGTSSLVESMEMGVVSPLHTALARAFELSRRERSLLPTGTYLGAVAGMVIAGPLADLWGRKRGLIVALVMICVSSCAHAVLPDHTSFWIVLTLRVVAGFAGALCFPTGMSLAVESCPREDRLWLVFAISFMSSLGYLLEALGVDWFMPGFGEKASDHWRGLCLFIGLPALVSLPLVALLCESPSLLAVRGRWSACTDALNVIAQWNGGHPRREEEEPLPRRLSQVWRGLTTPSTRRLTLHSLAVNYLAILLLLLVIDSLRSFFTSGSAYLCKDLFEITRLDASLSPTLLNTIASVSPLVGLIVGQRMVWMGVRNILFWGSVLAAGPLIALMFSSTRSIPWLLFALVLCYKLTYGPLGTCVSLMKVEAFPTEFRASAFATICVGGKLLCALGPTLVEALKQNEAASSWTNKNLAAYLLALAVAVILSGSLGFCVPTACAGDGLPLKDFSQFSLDVHDEGETPVAREGGVKTYGTLKD